MQKNSQEQYEEFTSVSSKSRADMKTTALDDDTKGTLESNITDTKSELRSAQPSATTVSLDLSGYSATTVKEILELIKDLLPEVISEGLAKVILALPMDPRQRKKTRVLREKLARRFA